MSRRSIWTIIILMSISLIGITIIQYYRIKWTIDLNEKNFDDKITMCLNKAKEGIEEDAAEIENSYDLFAKYLKDDKKANIIDLRDENWDLKQKSYKLNSIVNLINPKAMLERIDKDKLDRDLKQYFDDQGVSLDFDYGVYSMDANSFMILNGNYVAVIGESSETSSTEEYEPLYETEYQVSLFSNDVEAAGYLKVFFPKKQSYLWSTVRSLLFSTILFTGLILICFSYTIMIILRQKKISEMKTDFINNMTHEFKTPIATISLASDSIVNPSIIIDQNKIKRFVDIIKEENKRMLNQVEKVLKMAQIDKKDFSLKLSKVEMHELISKAVEYNRLQVDKRGGKIYMELNATNAVINGDENHLANLMHNLLDNANKYSLDKPEISISTRNTKSGFEINIIDKGIGMTKESIKHIFDKFYRVHTGNIHNVKGFGLGLNYVKAIVDAHLGTIKIESELGKGSSFIILLPQKSD